MSENILIEMWQTYDGIVSPYNVMVMPYFIVAQAGDVAYVHVPQ